MSLQVKMTITEEQERDGSASSIVISIALNYYVIESQECINPLKATTNSDIQIRFQSFELPNLMLANIGFRKITSFEKQWQIKRFRQGIAKAVTKVKFSWMPSSSKFSKGSAGNIRLI